MDRYEVEQRTILLALTGSRGYNLHTSTSDYDYRGVFIATKPYYLGLGTVEQKDKGWDTEEPYLFPFLGKDTTIYELRKFLSLSIDSNPNIMELLWCSSYEHLTPIGKQLIENRELFLSKKVRHTFGGYALSQLKKVETHRKWLLEPPTHCPTPKEYGLDEIPPLPESRMNAFLEYLYILVRDKIEFYRASEELYILLTEGIDYKAILKQHPLPEECILLTQELTRSPDEFIHLLQKTHSYRKAVSHYNNYLDWQKNRNKERAEMEARTGFDCKHSSHAVRLLRMGVEILKEGRVIVDREEAGDAQYLRDIKLCKYSYEEVMSVANETMDELKAAYLVSSLPERVDSNQVDNLCQELVTQMGFNG